MNSCLENRTESLGISTYDATIIQIIDYAYHGNVESSLALQRAKFALMDSLGCVIEALEHSKECRALIGPFAPGHCVPGGFKLPGTSFKLDPVKGAFDMATLTRFLDHNDAYPGAEWGHPSDNLGAILAVSDWMSRREAETPHGETRQRVPLTVGTLLRALIKAYEIQGCFQNKNAFNKVGLDHTILVKIASTAVVAWLMGLTQSEAAAALSHAWVDGGALRIFRQSPNAGPRKGWAAGDAAMRAVQLCLIAKAGQPGIPTALSDPEWGFLKVSFHGSAFQLPRPFGTKVMESVFFKLVAAEGHGISAVQAALELSRVMQNQGIDPGRDIRSIDIRTHSAACRIIDKQGPLKNAADRDHCMRYMVSVVLLKGAFIESGDYHDSSPWAHDPRVETLRDRISITEDPQFTEDYHNAGKAASGLTISLTDGTKLDEVLVEYPIGHPRHKDTLSKVQAKFCKHMQAKFTTQEVEEILVSLDDETLPVRCLLDLLARD